jgi:hypothetical protein
MSLHPDKTRLIDSVAMQRRTASGACWDKPETFSFLGIIFNLQQVAAGQGAQQRASLPRPVIPGEHLVRIDVVAPGLHSHRGARHQRRRDDLLL